MNSIRKIGFFTAFIVPALVITGYYLGGWWNFLAVIDVFLVLPILDRLRGLDTRNVPKEEVSSLSNDRYYRFVTYIWTYCQIAFLLWATYVVAFGNLSKSYEWIGFSISVALVSGGIGITVAHELGHKKSKLERFYSQVLLLTVCYMHFYIEHNRGHHVTVATKEDPATAFKNEDFYSFWLKSVFKGYAHAWKLENERMRRMNRSIVSIKNNMIWYLILPILLACILTIIFSLIAGQLLWSVALFFFVQSILAFSLLELVNYVEHYGLSRKEIKAGQYERVNPLHSWNASFLISNFFLFQLQRHSDHHANAIKRYQVLDHFDESPQLPAGYPTMILLALVPPLWFSIMNKKLEDWEVNAHKLAVK